MPDWSRKRRATGGKPAAAVAEPFEDQRIGRATLPLPNNKSNVFYTPNRDEAHYLAAFINPEPAQMALGRFAVSTGVTPAALARLPLPAFDGGDSDHVGLANLGRDAAQATTDGDAADLALVEADISQKVWAMVG